MTCKAGVAAIFVLYLLVSTFWGYPVPQSISASQPDKIVSKDVPFQLEASISLDIGAEEPMVLGDGESSQDHRTEAILGTSSQKTYLLSPNARKQVLAYRNGTGLLVNIHVTHHGGTTVCQVIGRAPGAKGKSPTFYCMGIRPQDGVVNETDYPREHPWSAKETAASIHKVRRYFHMIAWEYGRRRARPISFTDWEHPELLSLVVLRHPLARMLTTTSVYFRERYPNIHHRNASLEEWWAFAKDPRNNNFALAQLADDPTCCQNAETSSIHVRSAQALLRRTSILVDMECLGESLVALADLLGVTLRKPLPMTKPHLPPEAWMPSDVYEYLIYRNRQDIALYEWSKSLSLVRCS